MHRKEFIKTCSYACLAGTTLTVLLQGCGSSIYFAQSNFENNRIIVQKSEFLKNGKAKTEVRKFVLINTGKTSHPICLYRISESEYSALHLQCTHKGCELKPQENFLVCPCHGSEFTNKGVVQNPPAEKNLLTFKTTTDNENIYIHL